MTSLENSTSNMMVSTKSTQRSGFRQRLADAERGFTTYLRQESTFFLHLFATSIAISMAMVLGISWLEWIVMVLAVTLIAAGELIHFGFKRFWEIEGHQFSEDAAKLVRVITASSMALILGASLSIILLLGRKIMLIFC